MKTEFIGFTFPFLSTIIAFTVVGIIAIYFGVKIKQNDDILIKSKWLAFIEIFFDYFSAIVESTIGEENVKKFTPLAMTMFLTIFIGNILTLIGFQESATDINFPLAWALSMFIFWNIYGIYKIGIGSFFKDFFKPMWWMFPLEIIGFVTKPLTLFIRMFGNITSGFIMMGIFWTLPEMIHSMSGALGIASLAIFVPVGAMLSFYFSVFAPFIQATVFTYLVLVNLGLLINE
ncbi:MAG: F0F1 ATP synthase subunit A [Mycoplasmatales bacterium]